MKQLRWSIVLAVPSLGACAWWMAGRPVPANLDRIIFNHELHQEEGVECDSCHEGVAEAHEAGASYLPEEATCLDCHEKQDNCAMCHTDGHNPGRLARREHAPLGFSHARHLERDDVECASCHAQAMEATTTPAGRPSMATCLACHNHDVEYSQARCLGCHPDLRSLPLRAVAEFDHSGDWDKRHGLQARAQGESCLQCHQQSTCSECHSQVPAAANVRLFADQVERPLIHRGDWLSAHGIEARLDGDSCVRCHQGSATCRSCHESYGIGPGASRQGQPHPPGYALPGGSSFHGDDARLHVETCVACHDQGAASNCVTCHKVGGGGGNPHPSGWSSRFKPRERKGNPTCAICHIEG